MNKTMLGAFSSAKKMKQVERIKSSWREMDKENLSEDRLFGKSLKKKTSAKGGPRRCIPDCTCRRSKTIHMAEQNKLRLSGIKPWLFLIYSVSETRETEASFPLQDSKCTENHCLENLQLPWQRERKGVNSMHVLKASP